MVLLKVSLASALFLNAFMVTAKSSDPSSSITHTTTKTGSATISKSATGAKTTSTSFPNTSNSRGCARVAAAQASWAAGPNAAHSLFVPAEWANECLTSVPLVKDTALLNVAAVRNYWNFQTTLAYLADPPSDYVGQKVGLMAGLDNITDNINNNVYQNEYEYESALWQLGQSALEGHLSYVTYMLSSVFHFTNQVDLVQYSADGQSLPKAYFATDFISAIKSKQSISAVKTVNGQNISHYLEETALKLIPSQDPDARYNQMFSVTINAAVSDGGSGFNNQMLYPGPTTDIVFENGTSKSIDNLAIVKEDFSHVSSGKDFYTAFCVPTTTVTASGAATSSAASATSAPAMTIIPTYPKPLIAQDNVRSNNYQSRMSR
jgi:hypothetical protein